MGVVFSSPSALRQPPRPSSPSARMPFWLGTSPYERSFPPTVSAHHTSAFSRRHATKPVRLRSNVHDRGLTQRICRRDSGGTTDIRCQFCQGPFVAKDFGTASSVAQGKG